jgi:maltose alpha-D-glucosyltransferase/alpha-amylase
MVTDSERDYLWQTYATDRRARLNLGIRRRLAPLMERDRRRIELMNCLLISMPGTPVIYYGDEMGMGDNIRLGDRDGVRTPMQWSPDRNGGFSKADYATLALPTINDPLYGYETINVEAQTRDAHSLLHWMRRMLAVRRQHAAFGRGTLRFLYPKNRKVLAYLRELDGEAILCVANVSRASQAVELELSEFAGRVPIELNGGSLFPPIGQLTYLLTLSPFGFYWFILARESEAPSWHTPAPEPMPDYITVVLRNQLEEAVKAAAPTLERETLPAYLQKRRWFGVKDEHLRSANIAYLAPIDQERDVLAAEIEVETDTSTTRWQLPLSIAWEDEQMSALPGQLALARVRKGRRVGLLTDAFALAPLARRMLAALANSERIQTSDGEIVFEPTPDKTDVLNRPADAPVFWLTAEQSNSSLVVDDAVIVKIFRRITTGEHPEAEMSRYLTAHNFANAPALLGEVTRIDGRGERHALAVAQAFVRNQGDAWSWAMNQFHRAFDDTTTREASGESRMDDIRDYHAIATAIGRQLGTMHVVLAQPTDDQAFAPKQASAEDVAAWVERATGFLGQAFEAIAQRKSWDNERAEADANALLGRREALIEAVRGLGASGEGALMTRIHGDFHLGQVLVASGDAYIIDFEGEPARPLEERRRKSSPLRDVAGLLRSIDYAAASMADPKNILASRVSPGRRERLVTRLREGAEKAFLHGYREATSGLPSLDNKRLLDFFVIEKAAYEINYEAANRPSWLGIPVHGLARVAAHLLEPAEPVAA